MTARELFAVIVRSVGFIVLVVGLLGLGMRVVNHFMLPAYMLSAGEGGMAAGFAFTAAFGFAVLLATRTIVRVLYGPTP